MGRKGETIEDPLGETLSLPVRDDSGGDKAAVLIRLRRWYGVMACGMVLGVGFGAFGAHALKGVLDDYGREIYEKAVFYQFVHTLGGFAVIAGAKNRFVSPGSASVVLILLTAGVILFSGSLYLLALTGVRWLGAITPFGGTSLLLGWIVLAAGAYRKSG